MHKYFSLRSNPTATPIMHREKTPAVPIRQAFRLIFDFQMYGGRIRALALDKKK